MHSVVSILLLAAFVAVDVVHASASTGNIAKIINDDAGNLILNSTAGGTVTANGVNVEELSQQVTELRQQLSSMQTSLAALQTENFSFQSQLQTLLLLYSELSSSLALEQDEITFIYPGLFCWHIFAFINMNWALEVVLHRIVVIC